MGVQHALDAMKFLRENEYKGHVGEFLEEIIIQLKDGNIAQQFFCACFSLLKDALPMWREYGSNYGGVAIGFRPSAITSMPGRIQKVKYLNANTAEGYRQLVREIANEFRSDRSPDVLYRVTAITSILAAITALKHQTWEYEKEVRFVFAQVRANSGNVIPVSGFSDGTPIYWEAPLTRRRGATVVNYKAFRFGRRKQKGYEFSRAIAQVVIGPRCELTVEETKSELQGNGFEGVDVVRSNCEIR
ncbi:DUF2971 domain-containing protein [Bradyrhizobium sp.]|uniref:DUF2971 domain-containing protein n=1 Tax=Bradyrhizobium sp. TaxID=376 RepID=UPI002735E908|nr:DUF2971 domain-containing protein [Bradyrhizobium sp.]MDP3077102.1 DUF2971 domain-containing protein [Bradyrhizobium sp.]